MFDAPLHDALIKKLKYKHIGVLMSHVVIKPYFAYAKKKGADQLCSNFTAHPSTPLFCYTDGTSM